MEEKKQDLQVAEEQLPEIKRIPVIGMRLNFTSGHSQKFEFLANGKPEEIAAEINEEKNA